MRTGSSYQVVLANVVSEGKIQAIRYARENDVPMLGVCLGTQLTVSSLLVTPFWVLKVPILLNLHQETKYPIIDIMRDQVDVEDMGGTLRLGPSSV